MRVLVDIVHPADVLFFYHPIKKLQQLGHSVTIASRDKDVTKELLNAFGFEHQVISTCNSGVFALAYELIARDVNLWRLARRLRPDVMIGFGGISISHIGKILGIPSISFYDTETAPLQHFMTLPFITEMHVPTCYAGRTAKNRTFRFSGQKDFSYLHSDNFVADHALAVASGYQPGKTNYLLRIVAWNANHDIGMSGWDMATLSSFIKYLEQKGVVHISSEAPLPDHLAKYAYQGKVHQIHHLMAFCDVYIGESATMASEAVLLKTPAICAANIKLGYTDELAQQGLLWNVREVNIDSLIDAFERVEATSVESWNQKRHDYFADKQNLADTVVSRLLRYEI